MVAEPLVLTLTTMVAEPLVLTYLVQIHTMHLVHKVQPWLSSSSCPSSPDRSDTVELMEVIACQATASGNSGPYSTPPSMLMSSVVFDAWAISTSKNMELVLVSDSSCISSFFLHACKLLPSSIGVFVTCLVICRRVATTHNRCSMEVGTHSFTINFAKGKSARSAQLSPFTTSTTSVLVAEESGLPVVMHDFGPCRSKKKKSLIY